jgi:signal transduction histidine kinase
VNDLIIAALLIAQFWVVRWTWLLVLASGFLFTALIFVPFVLTFPGVFAPLGLLGSGLQTASWLSQCMHAGLLIFVIAAMLVRGSRETTGICQRSPGSAITLSVALVTAIVCVLTWVGLAYEENLPKFFLNSFQMQQSVTPMVAPVIALNIIALLLLVVRGRSVLDLWLTVMCFTWLIEILLGGLFAGSRFSLGWYTGRIVQIAATFIVLLLLLSETTALYANMARAFIQRRGIRQGRKIAMDAMAASIGHEIKQPLTAVLANAGACARQLKKPEPNLEEALAAAEDIAVQVHRISDIIGSARTMFKKSTHTPQLLNVNEVVQDVLSTVELDTRLQHVTVKTDLDNALPPVLADSGQLHQMFLNLFTNALEAMTGVTGRPGALTVTSSFAAGSSDIEVTVEDTGVGIADKDRNQIFEPFFSTKAAGSGVGLTVCQVIIKAHGGRLEVRANEPYGTIFRVILPMGGYE